MSEPVPGGEVRLQNLGRVLVNVLSRVELGAGDDVELVLADSRGGEPLRCALDAEVLLEAGYVLAALPYLRGRW